MFSESPSTPGRSAHVERAMMSMRRACLRRRVELVDDLRVDEVVELEPNPRMLSLGRGGGDRADLVDEPAAKRERRDEQLAERLRPPEAGDVVEEIGDVGRDLLVGREDAEVLVEPGCRRVVVAVPMWA